MYTQSFIFTPNFFFIINWENIEWLRPIITIKLLSFLNFCTASECQTFFIHGGLFGSESDIAHIAHSQ